MSPMTVELNAHTVSCLKAIRGTSPLVHNITNFVVMNSSANILLAMGASPVMAHSRDEVREMANLAGALVLNIGTLQEDWIEAMVLAGKTANEKGIPVILDPVGAGATSLRTRSVKRILEECRVTVLRGNVSEIMALTDASATTKGVDSTLSGSDETVEKALGLARKHGLVVAMSGADDCITDGKRIFTVANGTPLMCKVTGLGCGLSAVVGAFCAVSPGDPALSTASAFGFYGVCGELAAQASGKPGSFFTAFLDYLYTVGQTELNTALKMTVQNQGAA